MTAPVSNHPSAPISLSSNTVDGLLQKEHFADNSKAVKTGGQMSLINIQKDVDTLQKTAGKGVTQGDLAKDLQATGLSAGDANTQAMHLIAAAASGNTGELQNELAGLFKDQGGLDADHAQGLANQFMSLEPNSSTLYQTADQVQHGGTPPPPSSAGGVGSVDTHANGDYAAVQSNSQSL